MMAVTLKGPCLYEFLLEAELSHYYNQLKNDLKVTSVPQLKYVEDDDLFQLGMTKPEQRRLRKYFQKYFPQTYLRKIKNMILPKNKDDSDRCSIYLSDATIEKTPIKVPSKHIIPVDNIVINKELGVGEFGVVQQGVWTNEDGERIQVAIKCLAKERMQNDHMEFLKEAAIQHTIDHEHVVRLYGVVLDTASLMLVTELAPLRSLLECLKEPALRPSFPVVSLCDFALQICDGMQYLEAKRLIHRDLAARNILVFAKNKVKISDFGLSRALGVGKDYYQTNFNVNLKLPIAWCAPECITYLKFTSASDVWAYGVTLWETFSYGFQPWAALTGHQILEAIDEPNFQRLEQPECCPREYYMLMLKCWQHDANKRPKFSEIMQLLPECKPEQVQTIKDSADITGSPKPKKDWLLYQVGDVITVLDRRPLHDVPNLWKGILINGKTGFFNPVNTVAYLGHNLPTTTRPTFSRIEGKSGIYASRRRLRPDMISCPQGDFKHTGHVGLDGAFFGDISFLGDKYHQLPKQIVTPYKPHEDREKSSHSLTNTNSDASDRTPLLVKSASVVDGKSGPASADVWPDGSNDKDALSSNERSYKDLCKSSNSSKNILGSDHEYHEISDEEDFGFIESSKPETLDFGPSLMDEIFKALGTAKPDLEFDEQQCNENNNVKNEIKEITSKAVGKEGSKKKQAMVKPISAADQQTLDSAIAMAKELASKSMLELDCRSDNEGPLESPRTPTSPFKRKFSFKFKTSPKQDKRNFSEEAESIPDINDIITEEAKEVYSSLVDKGQGFEKNISIQSSTLPATIQLAPAESFKNTHRHHNHSQNHSQQHSTLATDSSDAESESIDSNPLRIIRSGFPVRPKVRGNKHGIPSSGRASTPRTATVARLAANAASASTSSISNGSRPVLGAPPPPPVPKSSFRQSSNTDDLAEKESSFSATTEHSNEEESQSTAEQKSDEKCENGISNNLNSCSNDISSDAPSNPLPLPPRDRSKPLPVLKHHHRRHPLVIPALNTTESSSSNITKPACISDSITTTQMSLSSHSRLDRRPSDDPTSSPSSENSLNVSDPLSSSPRINSSSVPMSTNNLGNIKVPPPKPSRIHSLDDSFETQIQAEIDSLDNIHEEDSSHLMYKSGDHVSCEDLLEFAMDRPNTRRTQGRSRGADSDEVRIMQKVLAKEQVTPEECLIALEETDWDVHKAIKYMRLQCILNSHLINIENCRQMLIKCNWDERQAANYLLATHNIAEDTTEV